jgi:predicted DNA-binding antitoxin AbrB/MazE fold protein
MSVRAIYENGVFKPATPVDLPERAEVELEIVSSTNGATASEQVPSLEQILSRRYTTGQPDAAERHDEHQP